MILSNVTLAYGNNIVASNINAELLPGELVCLIGRNGAGKSTLIRHILNTAGTPKEVAKEISVVLTDRIDIDGMTVHDIVSLGRSPYTGFFGKLSTEDEKIVSEALKTLSLEKYADRQVRTLSDGERQKAMIAKAIAQQTPYIILDEPTAFLDYPSKVETMHLLQKLCHPSSLSTKLQSLSSPHAILLSTHDLEISLRYCDKVWLIADKTLKVMKPEDFHLDSF